MSEYINQELLLPFIEEIPVKTKYISKNTNYDDIDETKTSGYGNPNNSLFFVEGYNIIQSVFSTLDDKLLMLSEDHFFQTGETIKELLENDYDVAYGDFESELAGCLKANGSILCINPRKTAHLFPLIEYPNTTVEWSIGHLLLEKIPADRRYSLSTRKHINYMGDGLYTNSSIIMEQALKKAGII